MLEDLEELNVRLRTIERLYVPPYGLKSSEGIFVRRNSRRGASTHSCLTKNPLSRVLAGGQGGKGSAHGATSFFTRLGTSAGSLFTLAGQERKGPGDRMNISTAAEAAPVAYVGVVM